MARFGSAVWVGPLSHFVEYLAGGGEIAREAIRLGAGKRELRSDGSDGSVMGPAGLRKCLWVTWSGVEWRSREAHGLGMVCQGRDTVWG